VAKLASTTSVKAGKFQAGKTGKLSVTVKVSGVKPAGKVRVTLNGKLLKQVSLAASKKGKASVTLPAFAKKGKYKVKVSYLDSTKQVKDSAKSLTITVK
jgi:flagellar hook assembly protein FlgD